LKNFLSNNITARILTVGIQLVTIFSENKVTNFSPKEKLNIVLFSMLGSDELVERWWRSPNYHWALSTPDDIWESSEDGKKQVIQYILGHAFG
jgi:hypothetical protein